MVKQGGPPAKKRPPYKNRIEHGVEVEYKGLIFHVVSVNEEVEVDTDTLMSDGYGRIVASSKMKQTITIEATRYAK
jgi:hypothetical protein